MLSRLARLIALAVGACPLVTVAAGGWPHYGGGLDGARFVTSDIITPASVERLMPVWTFRTGDATAGEGYFGRTSSFKATPILVDGRLIVSTGFNRVIAIGPESGEELWRFDPKVDFSISYAEMFTSRGVAAWRDPEVGGGHACANRIYLGTLDARLIAIDAASGKRCRTFGRHGEVDLSKDVKNFRRGEYSVTSPPTVVNGAVVVGSSIGDNGGVKLDAGVVRAFDARDGRLLWHWDPIPRSAKAPGWSSWEKDAGRRTGAANVWTAMAADAERDLVFLPTSSPSPDFFGGERLGDNRYANSIVALRVSSGEVAWAYQIVRHDLWDYDLASQPALAEIDVGGDTLPALILATKMGFVFVLNRETGEAIFPVTERPVPASDVAGERAAATQKFPALRLHPIAADSIAIWDLSAEHTSACKKMLSGLRFDGIFTPPSVAGTLLYPGNSGGSNWGSLSIHKDRQLAFVITNRLPTAVQLIPRRAFRAGKEKGVLRGVEAQFTEQSGTPFGMARFDVYNRDTGMPCTRGPWSTLSAIDLGSGKVAWERPLGVYPDVADHPQAAHWGNPVNTGGSIVTRGGVVFAATRFDRMLRAFDARDGRELWHAPLPAESRATPMSFELSGSQYVVVAAGGARADGEKVPGDFLVAFKVTAD